MSTRRLLVTAGPTWVPLDAVRHLANGSTGRMGATLARAAAAAGWDVTLLYGPGCHPITAEDEHRVLVLRFTTFDELHALLREQIGSRSHTGVVHAAAVSDYRPAAAVPGKIGSDAAELVLRLLRTPKLVDEIKRLDPEIVLVAFKLTVDLPREAMLRSAEALRRRCGAELMVANDQATFSRERHPALLLDESGVLAETETPEALAVPLLNAIERRMRR